MRKQALVQLHALCTLLREHLRNRQEFSTDALDCEGDRAGPTAIHRPKAEHRRAVATLTTDIAEAVDAERGNGGAVPDGETTGQYDDRSNGDGDAGTTVDAESS